MSNVINQFVDQVEDAKILITANNLNKPLIDAIQDGDIGAGASFKFTKVGHGLSVLQPVYHDGVDWVLATADQSHTLPLYLVTKVNGDTVTLTKFGKVEVIGHGLIAGEYYFASQTIAGGITSAEPTAGFSCPVLYVEDANNVHVIVHRPHLIGTGPGDDSEVGSVVAFATDIAPAGFIFCDGSAVSRAEYAELFAVVGTRHGQGDGSTTFNLPDLRGQFIRGVDNGAGKDPDAGNRTAATIGGSTGDAVGSSQGDATAKNGLTATSGNQSANHTHNRNNLNFAEDANVYPNVGNQAYSGAYSSGGNQLHRVTTTNINNQDHNHTITVTSSNAETRPLNVSMAFYIRYAPKPLLVPEVVTPSSGGGSFIWEASGDIAPLGGSLDGVEFYGFDNLSSADIFATIRVPGSYTPGNQIKLRGGALFSEVTSGNALLRVETRLIQPGSAVLGSLSSTYISTNTELTLSVANQVESIGTCNLTSANGLINVAAVQPGDILSIRLYRDFNNETSTAAGDVNFIKYSATVDFSGN